jgi:hypothetical protein
MYMNSKKLTDVRYPLFDTGNALVKGVNIMTQCSYLLQRGLTRFFVFSVSPVHLNMLGRISSHIVILAVIVYTPYLFVA